MRIKSADVPEKQRALCPGDIKKELDHVMRGEDMRDQCLDSSTFSITNKLYKRFLKSKSFSESLMPSESIEGRRLTPDKDNSANIRKVNEGPAAAAASTSVPSVDKGCNDSVMGSEVGGVSAEGH
ncbi:uncharacterized protein LOC112589067 isoform X4 [Harpegnathos saltator]|uniref:uncharacterized protein LOC105190413 isoform X4 n=1 Tax=Harpegnathos saltator TaxID=610380 RepID=UPI000DBED155|nr:uncharacterized protein LOC105190413 isoform X4 [Harpegnathos saltator]XP_025156725.1 uncharacterized protein LOC112589067 isoform X4 [Harpegnathos saltator]